MNIDDMDPGQFRAMIDKVYMSQDSPVVSLLAPANHAKHVYVQTQNDYA